MKLLNFFKLYAEYLCKTIMITLDITYCYLRKILKIICVESLIIIRHLRHAHCWMLFSLSCLCNSITKLQLKLNTVLMNHESPSLLIICICASWKQLIFQRLRPAVFRENVSIAFHYIWSISSWMNHGEFRARYRLYRRNFVLGFD